MKPFRTIRNDSPDGRMARTARHPAKRDVATANSQKAPTIFRQRGRYCASKSTLLRLVVCVTFLRTGVTLAASAPPPTSLNNCQNAVKAATAAFVHAKISAVTSCLQAVSTQVVKANGPDAHAAAGVCVTQFRRLYDSRGMHKQLSDHLAASIAKKCDPTSPGVTHTVGDVVGAGATVSQPLNAADLAAWCASFGGSGSITTLQDWASCIGTAAECDADSAIASQYPRALDWLALVKPSMLLLTPPATDPNKIADAVTALDAVKAEIDGPDNDGFPSIHCGCGNGQATCGGSCVNEQNDPQNCGGCGNACAAGRACVGGSCACINSLLCTSSCVDPTSNVQNCGSCGHSCSFANATAACSNSSCTIGSCNAGFANCDMVAANGCEINTNTSPMNCGGCGMVCNTANATPGCSNGTCTVASCNAGFANCDMVAANGCEVNTTNDANHCGACGHACGAGHSCVNSICM